MASRPTVRSPKQVSAMADYEPLWRQLLDQHGGNEASELSPDAFLQPTAKTSLVAR